MTNNDLPNEEFPCPSCGATDHDSRTEVLDIVAHVREKIEVATMQTLRALEGTDKTEFESEFQTAVWNYGEARRFLLALMEALPEYCAIKANEM